MYSNELSQTMDNLLQEGKGILAADESNSTIGKRFKTINVENTAENRRDYRLLLATTPDLSQYINAVILFEETYEQQDKDGKLIPQIFADNGIIPGIKVDKGLITLPNTENEQITQGLDGLTERLLHYKQLGAKFAKWRNVYTISEFTPSQVTINSGAEVLARYAASCQELGIVPIVEPEILMEGDHCIDDCCDASEMVLHAVFHALFMHNVQLEHIILKPSMISSGMQFKPFSSPEEIAEYTLNVFRNNVPAAVPSINFLSGGQTPQSATANLNAINNHGYQPWNLSFSYGRALQEDCLQAWRGNSTKIKTAQAILLKRAQLNSSACFGEYNANME